MVAVARDKAVPVRVMDVCPFTNLPCGISDLCWSADCLCDGYDVPMECSRTACQGYVVQHLRDTKLCPFSDEACVDVGSCKDALVFLLEFDPSGSHGYFGDFGVGSKRSCPYPVVRVRKGR